MNKIARTLLPLVEHSLFKKQVIIIYGPRQVGKSTLVKDFLTKHHGMYFSCDDPTDRAQLEGRSSRELLALIGNARIVVIDEAQLIPDVGITLKLLADNIAPDVQIIATGSSSFDLANKVNEPLTGRNRKFHLYPVSLSELVMQSDARTVQHSLESHIVHGLYPAVVTAVGRDEKVQTLRDLAADYVYKDILSFNGIRDSDAIKRLVSLLALRIGTVISYTDLAKHLGMSRDTVFQYVSILEKAFIVFRLTPFATNKEKEFTKNHKVYFYDTGIRNAILGNYDPLSVRTDAGALFENFVIAEVVKQNAYTGQNADLHFWRTYAGSEVDMVEVSRHGERLRAFECKLHERGTRARAWESAYPSASFQEVHLGNIVSLFTDTDAPGTGIL